MSAGDGATTDPFQKWEYQNLAIIVKERAVIIVNRHVLSTPTKTRGVLVVVLDAWLVGRGTIHEPLQQILSMEAISRFA